MATLLPNRRVPVSELQGYRIFIFSHDHPHPPHIHVGKKGRTSKWHLVTLECTSPDGFSSPELRVQRKILLTKRLEIWRAWDAYWKDQYGAQ
jgi:hypothetical protein